MQEEDSALEQGCIDSVRRVQALREAHFRPGSPQPGLEVVGCASHRDLAARIEATLS